MSTTMATTNTSASQTISRGDTRSRGEQSPERGRGRRRRRRTRSHDRGGNGSTSRSRSRSRSRHSEDEENHQEKHHPQAHISNGTSYHDAHPHTQSESHPAPTLFPSSPLPLTSLEGSWTLIASTASMWQARRGVTMTIAAPRSGKSSSSFLQATWTFYELGSFKPKTLVQRIREYHRAKQAARHNAEDQEQRPGENKESQSGVVFEGSGSDEHTFFYKPQNVTLEKALGKRKIKWEVIGYGDDSQSSPSNQHNDHHHRHHHQVDWFIAYIHNVPLLTSPFLSIYIRKDVMAQEPSMAKVLCRDVMDELAQVDMPDQMNLQYLLRRMGSEMKMAKGLE